MSLSAGTECVPGNWSADPDSVFNQTHGGVTLDVDPRITLLRNRDKAGVAGLVFPDREPSNIHLGSFGPTMLIADPATPIPLPAALPVLVSAVGLLAMMRRRRA